MYFNDWQMNDVLSYFAPIRFIGLDMYRNSSYDVKSNAADVYNFYNRTHKNHIIEIFKF